MQAKNEENKPEEENENNFNEDNNEIDIEYNQGVMSNWEESGGMIGQEQNKDLVFENQMSLIQWFDDIKENSCIEIKDLNEIEFDKEDEDNNSSGFMKLNDSIVKNREVWKDKTERRNSYKNSLGNQK